MGRPLSQQKDHTMGYGICIVLEPDYLITQNSNPEHTAVLLRHLASDADPVVTPHGGRTVISHTPKAVPPIAHVNVWVDQAGPDLRTAMTTAADLSVTLQDRGLIVSVVEVLDWQHNPVFAG